MSKLKGIAPTISQHSPYRIHYFVQKKCTTLIRIVDTTLGFFTQPKGRIKPKPDWPAVESPKKRTNKFVLFAFLLFCFSQQTNQTC